MTRRRTACRSYDRRAPSTDGGALIDPLATYRALSDSIFTLYERGQQRDAIALLETPHPELLPWQAELAHLKACLHGSLGETDEALETLATAHAAGAWWDPSILLEDDDLESLTWMREFMSLVESSRERWAQANAEPDRTGDRLVLPSGPVRGVVVALHGAEEDADDAMAVGESVTELGFGVLAVRSSQRTSPRYRSWPDQQRAVAEIAGALETLPDEVRSLPLVAGGFSAGGRVAFHWAFTGVPCPVAGLIVVAPAVRGDLGEARPAVLDPAVLLVGSDDDLSDEVVTAGRALAASGLSLEVVPGLGHRFPEDFPERLRRALEPVG